ncbi:fumarylacetoacetate hydrolase family protein [Parvularcula sp. LCG005]|uniref:fumarylacetoacetate hydrolase family protein n=1 Tax=Parvularcula sp. LCG005 TaxID=3078805 RepID=UPI0029433DF6|nr:fumarylacetoacetate hydrolase family protein [Parvularcula sp. LCG005]WOI52158.1 fumarylacetoacetate hydrolase family protein [Parvularcula sp. LCG005]
MKFLRVGAPGQERPAVVDADGKWRDLSGHVTDLAGSDLDPDNLRALASVDLSTLPVIPMTERVGPCVGHVPKFICVGLNYADHAAETGAEPPTEPILFAKATSSICGPNDDVIKPLGSTKMDWEVELGIVIGKTTRHVSEANALNHVAGYCVINDISERAFQIEMGGQWMKGKGCDTFGPIGPWLVTPDEVPDPLSLGMWLKVNGHQYQDGSTKTMIFGPAFLVSYISRFMTLEPGDIISSGTPPGVGLGQKPPVFLNAGDRMALGIDGLGEQHQLVVAYEEQS